MGWGDLGAGQPLSSCMLRVHGLAITALDKKHNSNSTTIIGRGGIDFL